MYPLPALINEFQHAPNPGLELKAILNERDKYGLVWITRSQKIGLQQTVVETLSGCVASFELLPLSSYELQGKGTEHKPFLPSGELTRGSFDLLNPEEIWSIIWQGS